MKTRLPIFLLLISLWLLLMGSAADSQAAPSAPVFVDSGISTFTPVRDGAVVWGDSDGDGDLDLLVTGNSSTNLTYNPVTKLYLKNSGNAYFEVPAATTNLIAVQRSAAAWGDYNNDGRLDLLLCGETNGGTFVTRIYRNDGNNQFADITAGLTGVHDGAAAWADYDADGKLDVVVAGESASGAVTRLYRNNGDNTFSPVNVTLAGVSSGSVAWSDYNHDGRPDLLIVGPGVSQLYRNVGPDSFAEVPIGLSVLNVSAVAAWGDVNSDGWPDIALVGKSDVVGAVANIYRNNGDGTFTDLPYSDTHLTPVGSGAGVAWGDYDNDGRSDLLLNGNGDVLTRVFHNDGNITFTLLTEAGLPALERQAFAWGDFNNSGQLDIGLIGSDLYPTLYAKIYSNTIHTTNAAPAAPGNLATTLLGNQIQLHWSAPIDDHTPAPALTYSIRVGTMPGGTDVVSPPALSTGQRQIPASGSSITTTVALNLEPGTYYWSVQAVDSAFAGSAFATEGSFVVPRYLFLPLVALNAVTYFPGTTEIEPNNTFAQANGPLASGQTLSGTHNDQWDAFNVYLPTAGTVHVTVQTPRTSHMQLQVYYQNVADPNMIYRPSPPYHLDYTGAAGWYYIFIFNESLFNADTYMLTVTYP